MEKEDTIALGERVPDLSEHRQEKVAWARAFLKEIEGGVWDDFILIGYSRTGIVMDEVESKLLHTHIVYAVGRWDGDKAAPARAIYLARALEYQLAESQADGAETVVQEPKGNF